jgi:hypothetical protein
MDVADGYRHRRWVEQIALSGESTVTIERFERARRKSGQFRESSMVFRASTANVPDWSHPFEPLALYEDEQNEELTIVARLAYCEDYYEQGYPRVLFLPERPPTLYLEYRLRRGKWVRVPLSPASIGRSPNLLGNASAGDRSVIAVDPRSTNCGRTTYSAPIHDAEDAILAILDRELAPLPARQRAEEFLAGSRVVHERDVPPAGWKPDDDPLTIQTVMNGHYNGGTSGVSPDGQVIYIGGRRPSNDESRWIAESYLRRMRAAGLGQYAPGEPQAVPP